MRPALRLSLTATALSLLLAGCGAAVTAASAPDDAGADAGPDATATATPDTAEVAPDDLDPQDDPRTAAQAPTVTVQDAAAGFDVHLDGSRLEVMRSDGTGSHGFELAAGEIFHSFTVRPGSSAGEPDVVVMTLRGERPVLYALTVRATDAVLEAFPDHLQPAHEVDAAPPALGWTPDGRSLVWAEPTGEGVVLRTVGWDDGPGTGRPADDNASFALDAPADVRVDGFEVTDGSWTLLLRPGAGGDPIEVRIERQNDGALALPG